MRVLIVGKGNSGTRVLKGHSFTFVDTPFAGFPVPSLDVHDLAMFHLSEDCDEDDGRFARVLDEWKRAGACAKIIAISGGKELHPHQARRLQDLGGIPFISDIEDEEALFRLSWQMISPDSTESATNVAHLLQGPVHKLEALCILCQAYAAAGIAKKEIPVDGQFATLLGWSRLTASTVAQHSERLAEQWPRLKSIEWWRVSLGIGGEGREFEAKCQPFFAQLIRDLRLDKSFPGDAGVSGAPLAKLREYLEKQKSQPAAAIVKLLTASKAEPAIVEAAYRQVKAFLEP